MSTAWSPRAGAKSLEEKNNPYAHREGGCSPNSLRARRSKWITRTGVLEFARRKLFHVGPASSRGSKEASGLALRLAGSRTIVGHPGPLLDRAARGGCPCVAGCIAAGRRPFSRPMYGQSACPVGGSQLTRTPQKTRTL